MISRRAFIAATGATPIAGRLLHGAQTSRPTPKVALITTVWRFQSHAQHMGDRFLVGYPANGQWHQPSVQIASAYVDQINPDDLSAVRAEEFGFRCFPSIRQALCLDGDELAVDAVLIIGEHGQYPRNERGQILYPRYEFFQEVVSVFRRSRRAVPVFNDKHLSYSFFKAREMVQAARGLDFPLMAGSSLPVTFRLPAVEMPWEAEIEEGLMVGCGGSDPMDFHAFEAMQCMLERRRGGETGVRSVQLVDGASVWQAADQGLWSNELLAAALSRSNQLQGLTRVDARPQDLLSGCRLRELAKHPSAYLVEYRDGTRATLLMLNGAVNDYTFAAKVKGRPDPISTLFYLPPTPNVVYSAELMKHVERLFVTGKASYPVERTLLVSGLLESCLESRRLGSRRLATPQLNVTYEAVKTSQFATT